MQKAQSEIEKAKEAKRKEEERKKQEEAKRKEEEARKKQKRKPADMKLVSLMTLLRGIQMTILVRRLNSAVK